jgi:hypothetical protein
VVLSAKDDLDIEAESFARGNFVWGVTIVGMDVDRGVSISRVSSSSYLDPWLTLIKIVLLLGESFTAIQRMWSEVELTWTRQSTQSTILGVLAGRQMLGPTSETKQDSSIHRRYLTYLQVPTRQDWIYREFSTQEIIVLMNDQARMGSDHAPASSGRER